jgi:hypothetical protein
MSRRLLAAPGVDQRRRRCFPRLGPGTRRVDLKVGVARTPRVASNVPFNGAPSLRQPYFQPIRRHRWKSGKAAVVGDVHHQVKSHSGASGPSKENVIRIPSYELRPSNIDAISASSHSKSMECAGMGTGYVLRTKEGGAALKRAMRCRQLFQCSAARP